MFHSQDPGLELFLPEHSLRITLNQPGTPLPQFMALRSQALGRLPLGATPWGVLPRPIFRFETLGMFQQPTDCVPDGHFPQVGAPRRVRTNPLPPEPIGSGPQTAIIRLRAGVALATTRADRFALVRIAPYFADQETVEYIADTTLALPGAPTSLGYLLLDKVLQLHCNKGRNRHENPFLARHLRTRMGLP